MSGFQGSDVFSESVHIQVEADEGKRCLVGIAQTASGSHHLCELPKNCGTSSDHRHHDQQKACGQAFADGQAGIMERVPSPMQNAFHLTCYVVRSRWHVAALELWALQLESSSCRDRSIRTKRVCVAGSGRFEHCEQLPLQVAGGLRGALLLRKH